MLDRLEDVRAWQFFKYPQIISYKKRMPRVLETESKYNYKSDNLNCVFNFKIKIDCTSCLLE